MIIYHLIKLMSCCIIIDEFGIFSWLGETNTLPIENLAYISNGAYFFCQDVIHFLRQLENKV